MKGFFDTHIVIDFLNGVVLAKGEIDLYDDCLISRISWMEVLAGADKEEEDIIRLFLRGFSVIEINEKIAAAAVRLRRTRRLKLPDAVILASAQEHGCQLITRNTKDFSPSDPVIRVPYTLQK